VLDGETVPDGVPNFAALHSGRQITADFALLVLGDEYTGDAVA